MQGRVGSGAASMEARSSTPTQERDWSSLPADLLKSILERLPWSSHPGFAAACTHWRSAVSPFYPASLTPVLLSAVDVGSSNIRYYSPYYHKIFEIAETLNVPNAKICCASGDSQTLCQCTDDGELTIVDVNLITGVIKKLNPLEHTMFDFVYHAGRKMFGIDVLMACVARATHNDDDGCWNPWEFSELSPHETTLTASPVTNPVLHHGLLYVLHVDVRLAVHDDSRHDQGLHFLDKPQGFGFECDDCYLFESDEVDLMAVLMGHRGSPLHIVKLDGHRMEWEKVESLEGRALFTGTLTTMMAKTNAKWMQSKVFLPRLYDWPEIVQVDLIDRGGELAFVPKSTVASKDRGACGKNIWTCGLRQQEAMEFSGTTNVDYSIWVNFKNIALY